MSAVNPFSRWREIAAGTGGAAAYQDRFDALEASGHDVHGEARFIAGLVPPPARILDAGCGTGRVAAELTRRGYRCVGVDEDPDMIAVARSRDPNTHYVRQDLATFYLRAQAFDVVVLAGNVVPLLAPGTLAAVMQRIHAHTPVGGLVVAGFGITASHLPDGCPVTPVSAYDRACTAAGLSLAGRWSSWDRHPWPGDHVYALSMHRHG